jgi:hypothetical protein
MGQQHTALRSGFTDVTTFFARHPRSLLTIVLLLCFLASQGAVSAETVAFGDAPLVEPNSGHGATTGP